MLERRQRRRRSLSSTGKIGKYALKDAIRTQPGRTLFRSYDPFLDRDVAIKIIQLFDPSDNEDPEANDAFFAEAQAIGRLQHQNIVSVYDAGIGDFEGYIVMEYIHGESLLNTMSSMTPLDNSLRIAAQICHALHYAHAKNVVHRDIKPSNIMISFDGVVKVVDFGISILRSEDQNVPGLMGTPSYMAPELVHGSQPNELSDLFSVAVVLYEMITGRLPFSGKDAHAVLYQIINSEPLPIEINVPDPVKVLLGKALSKNPEERFQRASEFEDELYKLREHLSMNSSELHDMDTAQLQQMNVFPDCNLENLRELAKCMEIHEFTDGEDLIKDGSLDDNYLCLIHGKAMLCAGQKKIAISSGQWLLEKTLRQGLGEFNCKVISNSQVLRVSKTDLLMTSSSTQAYFYQFILDRFFLRSS